MSRPYSWIKNLKNSKVWRSGKCFQRIVFADFENILEDVVDGISCAPNRNRARAIAYYFHSEHSNIDWVKIWFYPSEYTKSTQQLEETVLPNKEAFDLKLTGKTIFDENYTFVNGIWQFFNLRTLERFDGFVYENRRIAFSMRFLVF